MKTPLYALCAAALFGCAPNYVYTPETRNAVSGGLPSTRTAIPQEQPQGSVEVTSYGTTELQQGNARVPAVQVRMTIINDGDDTPWTLDTNRQLLEIPGEGRSAPMFVNGDAQGFPNVTIARRERRTLDLYYPLPATIKGERELPRFDLQWEITTPARTVASSTAFDRVEQQAASPVYVAEVGPYWAGYGPYWWYDPLFPRTVYIHSRPIIIQNRRAPVTVGRFDGRFRSSPRVEHRGR